MMAECHGQRLYGGTQGRSRGLQAVWCGQIPARNVGSKRELCLADAERALDCDLNPDCTHRLAVRAEEACADDPLALCRHRVRA